MSTKIDAAVDALGNPVRVLLTEGQASEYGTAEALITGISADSVVADKGHDSDALVAFIEASGMEAVIPPRRNRKTLRSYDRHVYRLRNLQERYFQKVKQYRRLATRYERLARNYASLLELVSTVIWLA